MTQARVKEVTIAEVKAIGSTGEHFSMEEVGTPTSRAVLIAKIASAPKAGIIFVSGYEAKHGYGEVADYVYLKGISYANMKDNSLAKLDEIESQKDFAILVRYKAWKDGAGNEYNRKAKGRSLETISHSYKHGDPKLTEAIAKVRNSIENPREFHVDYEKHGNGIYEHEDVLHIRDCMVIRKTVVRKGDYPDKATSEPVALADAIKRLLPISKYRQVRLDGRFDYIAVNGELVLQSEGGEKVYVTFNELKGNIEPRIVRSDDKVEQKKDEVQEEIGIAQVAKLFADN